MAIYYRSASIPIKEQLLLLFLLFCLYFLLASIPIKEQLLWDTMFSIIEEVRELQFL